MSVLVKIIGENDDSDEYIAAERMKDIIESSMPSNVIGEIILYPSATLFGQTIKDIDILMIGNINNYTATVKLNSENGFYEEKVSLKSFCTTIEVKSHSISGIKRQGTNLYVRYSKQGWHNVTRQSNEQKISAMRFFSNALGESPFITNIIWFTEIGNIDLEKLLSEGGNIIPFNVLPHTFKFDLFVQLIAYQKKAWVNNGKCIIDSSFNGRDAELISKPLLLFSRIKTEVGELTRQRIEYITKNELTNLNEKIDDISLNIIRGRAGTGKTVQLIRYAIKLVEEKSTRVQILTYNKALVSDIRRLFTLAELPDMFEEKCVSINTMQSYFYGIINNCLYDGQLSGKDYLKNYETLIDEMVDFIKTDDTARSLIKDICEDNPQLCWDYILIDEAQDWSEGEKNLILNMYEKDHVLVADGGNQYVRSLVPCDWTQVPNRNNIKLKYCLRQKNNLIKFINGLSKELYSRYNPIVGIDSMIGGRILVITNNDYFYQTIKEERIEMIKRGNKEYDMLFLVPSSLVSVGIEKSFLLKKEFEKRDILIWDGTNENNRHEFSINIEESRVLQYESARGLEGWCVCCMNLDEFIQNKYSQFIPINIDNPLLLESSEDIKSSYILNWVLIPLTRAIDTLIITLKDTESWISKEILKQAELHPDYIHII